MRVLMVSPFPPLRDGVGKYAAQEVVALREEGHSVDVLAPVACAAQFVVSFKSARGGLARLRRYARLYDRVVLQYQPDHFHKLRWGRSRVFTTLWMAVAFRTIRNLVVVCHEVDYPPLTGRTRWRPEMILERLAWRGARHVEFHTTHEVEEMRRHFGVVPRNWELRDHGRYFKPTVAETQKEARRRLGMPEDVRLVVCIGFIQPHKGFDRAIRAFRRVPGNARLAVVGSVREETAEHRSHLYALHDLAATDERVAIHARMVSDEEFDRWIVASDSVVLPYRQIWSSGVFERARVLDRPVIASAAGGMSEQSRPGDVIVADDDELAEAIAAVVGEGPPRAPEPMSITAAVTFVEEETRRRGAEAFGSAVDRNLNLVDASRGVFPVVLPSKRRFVGPIADLAKRVLRRSLGWLLMPMMGQINEFERLTVDVLKAIVSEQRGTASDAYDVHDYPEFERRFRGESDTIVDRMRPYVEEFVERAPVLDVGCGRGEFLELLRDEGIEARGVDLSLEMVLLARARGLQVDQGDGIKLLRSLPPGSLGGVMACQVVEHLSPRALIDLLAAARRVLRPGGVLICETINPQTLFALANWYTMDLTHSQPVHPQTLQFLAEDIGFRDVEIRYLVPAKPPREPLEVDDAPEWAQTLAKSVDEDLSSLNEVVFGPQDYALVARA